ncbi:hypothetical protein FRX31_034335 [Thalictrum thalictroides]|uniref:Uncharacterized protein n=1 Tax=Thalictrum thalictroides TaxID=46969 RepID=A0A7J6UUE5_THATH|nr:hypothetical protein FRX31_034335 [Thalictrum thalictroides]
MIHQHKITTVVVPADQVTCVGVGSNIYALGGYDPTYTSNPTIYNKANTAAAAWEKLPSMLWTFGFSY